jgi:hypothetical protein
MRLMKAQRCSDFAPRLGSLNVLIVGAERSDEFADAGRFAARGHQVTVVNFRESVAARRFQDAGGTFVQSRIERLPLTLGPFDLVCENYPYTVARVEGVCESDPCPIWLSIRAIRTYAVARLRRLASGGRWILFTESPGFTGALRWVIGHDPGIRRNFRIRTIPLKKEDAPPSCYARFHTRFQIIFERRPAEPASDQSIA